MGCIFLTERYLFFFPFPLGVMLMIITNFRWACGKKRWFFFFLSLKNEGFFVLRTFTFSVLVIDFLRLLFRCSLRQGS